MAYADVKISITLENGIINSIVPKNTKLQEIIEYLFHSDKIK